MTTTEKQTVLWRLGDLLSAIGHQKPWSGSAAEVDAATYRNMEQLVCDVHLHNGWFTEQNVRKAFLSIASWLKQDKLKAWVEQYKPAVQHPKRVGIIMAGSIPLVGFHDFMAVLLSGNKAVVKLSSDDRHLFPELVSVLTLFDPRIRDWITIVPSAIGQIDAVIATGSNNSARYFESYFGTYPHIIRKNRRSIAVLNGSETKEELAPLGADVFDYFGLGCRSVSQLWLPEKMDTALFFEAIYGHHAIIHHHKYANNYDYNKAIYLMNNERLLDNGFLLLKEDHSLHSPLAVLHYVRYREEEEVKAFLQSNQAQIQIVLGHDYVPFGQSQSPDVSDYADGVDTFAFLTQLA